MFSTVASALDTITFGYFSNNTEKKALEPVVKIAREILLDLNCMRFVLSDEHPYNLSKIPVAIDACKKFIVTHSSSEDKGNLENQNKTSYKHVKDVYKNNQAISDQFKVVQENITSITDQLKSDAIKPIVEKHQEIKDLKEILITVSNQFTVNVQNVKNLTFAQHFDDYKVAVGNTEIPRPFDSLHRLYDTQLEKIIAVGNKLNKSLTETNAILNPAALTQIKNEITEIKSVWSKQNVFSPELEARFISTNELTIISRLNEWISNRDAIVKQAKVSVEEFNSALDDVLKVTKNPVNSKAEKNTFSDRFNKMIKVLETIEAENARLTASDKELHDVSGKVASAVGHIREIGSSPHLSEQQQAYYINLSAALESKLDAAVQASKPTREAISKQSEFRLKGLSHLNLLKNAVDIGMDLRDVRKTESLRESTESTAKLAEQTIGALKVNPWINQQFDTDCSRTSRLFILAKEFRDWAVFQHEFIQGTLLLNPDYQGDFTKAYMTETEFKAKRALGFIPLTKETKVDSAITDSAK